MLNWEQARKLLSGFSRSLDEGVVIWSLFTSILRGLGGDICNCREVTDAGTELTFSLRPAHEIEALVGILKVIENDNPMNKYNQSKHPAKFKFSPVRLI